MPVSILKPQQRRNYGRFPPNPSPDQIAKYCLLTISDLQQIGAWRPEPWQRMGYAVQLMTVRFIGTFLEADRVLGVPRMLLQFAAKQLGLNEVPDMALYERNADRVDEHRKSIRKHFGYLTFGEGEESYLRWLNARILRSTDEALALFDLSTAWCIDNRVLLPAASTLERHIASVRESTLDGVCATIADVAHASPGLSQRLLSLTELSPETGRTALDMLAKAPTRKSIKGLLAGEQRIAGLQRYQLSKLDLGAIPEKHVHELARYAAENSSSHINQLQPVRKLATLFAFVSTYETIAIDEFLDLFVTLLGELAAQTDRDAKQARLDGQGELDDAALDVVDVCEVLIDEMIADAQIRPTAYSRVSLEKLVKAMIVIRRQCRRNPKAATREMLAAQHRRIAALLVPLNRALHLEAEPGATDVLQQIAFLKRAEVAKKPDFANAPLTGLSAIWRPLVVSETGQIKRDGYLAWTATRLNDALRRHDLYVPRSRRWGSVHEALIPDDRVWRNELRPQYCLAFDLPPDGASMVERMSKELSQAYADATRALGTAGIRSQLEDGELAFARIEAEPVPESRPRLRSQTLQMMPVVDVAEILMEINATTHFARAFIPAHHSLAGETGIERTICAALLAGACNLTYSSVSNADDPALSEERIAYVRQHFIRADTITNANNQLLDVHDRIPLVRKYWGDGHIASADGLRFRVAVSAANALPNRKYFGTGKGITYFTTTSDQFTGLHGQVFPGATRDSLYSLEARIRITGPIQPTLIMTDKGSASDAAFAMYWFQGYAFQPEFGDLGDNRYWRMNAAADYGPWNSRSKNMLSEDKILGGYDDVLRLSASLREGRVSAHAVMQMLGGVKRALTPLGKSVREIGRAFKSVHLLRLSSELDYARKIRRQLNRGEQRNGLARRLCYGQRGELHQAYVRGQEDQLNALGFVLNVIVVWNTMYLDAALRQIRSEGGVVNDADIEHLSPLVHEHIRIEGRYQFDLAPNLASGNLRPLRKARIPSIFAEIRDGAAQIRQGVKP